MTKVLLLYDEITPAMAKEFIGQMLKVPLTNAVTVAVNSPGGSVPAGDAIALAVDRHRGPTTARIGAVAASSASFIAMFCDKIIMAPGSFLMIHCPYATMAGTADELTNAAAVLRAIEPLLRNVFSSFWAACGRNPYDDATGDLALGSRCCPA